MKIATLSRKTRIDNPLELSWRIFDNLDIVERARERQQHKKFLSKTTGKYIYHKYRRLEHSSKGKPLKTNAICSIGEASNTTESIPERANAKRRSRYGNYR